MIPLNTDTRESYVQRNKDGHLKLAEMFHDNLKERSMWLHLLYWAMAEDIYGEHWDELKGTK